MSEESDLKRGEFEKQSEVGLGQVRNALNQGFHFGDLAKEIDWVRRSRDRFDDEAREGAPNEVANYTTNKLLQHIQAGNAGEGIPLIYAFEDFCREAGWPEGKAQNLVASYIVVTAMMVEDGRVRNLAVGDVLPREITKDHLAYHLASFLAITSHVAPMAQAVRRGIQLGYGPSKFLDDVDFAPYKDNEEFLDALRGGEEVSYVDVSSVRFAETDQTEDGGEEVPDGSEEGPRAVELDADFETSRIFEVFPLEFDDGYFESDAFEQWIPSADADALLAVCRLIRDGFTFVPGGDWTPTWMTGERRAGSPLQLLEPTLERLSALDSSAHLAISAELLRYVACDEDVFVHDAWAMSQNMASEMADQLSQAELNASDGFMDALVESVVQLCESGSGIEYGVNAIPLAVACLEAAGPESAVKLVNAIDVFAGQQARDLIEENPFDRYAELMNSEDVAAAVDALSVLANKFPGLEPTLANGREFLAVD